MSFWNKSERNPRSQRHAAKTVHGEAKEEAAETIVRERMFNHWLDQAYDECEKNGEFDHLPGKGKPIDVQTGDPLNSILKHANVLPPWLELQHEIRDAIAALLPAIETGDDTVDASIGEINKKIAKYNAQVPTSVLQKAKITRETAAVQYRKWI